MISESKVLAFYLIVVGKTLGAQIELIDRLKKRLQLRQVYAVEDCDVILAFSPIVSRAGTDINAALQQIDARQPVVLVMFHHTFDPNYLPPESMNSVQRERVVAVDILFYEDVGLLRSLHNDKGLKSITDYLITLGASPNVLLPVKRCSPHQSWKIVFFISCALIILALLIVLFLECFKEL